MITGELSRGWEHFFDAYHIRGHVVDRPSGLFVKLTKVLTKLFFFTFLDKCFFQLVLKLKGRRKLGTKYTIAEHLLNLSTLCLESNRQQ